MKDNTQTSSGVKIYLHINNYSLSYYCPGCKRSHSINYKMPTNPQPVWQWNGSLTVPTFHPSVDCSGYEPTDDFEIDKPYKCHSFITNGVIHFLSDCTHSLAGQHIPMPDWP